MFMITPKATGQSTSQKSSQLPSYQSTSRAARAARVQKACDRCRLKKIKCDGDLPCLRCGHDKVLCTQSKRTQNDPKAVTREYINSLESRQMNLVKTLQEVLRHAQQPAGEDAMQKILITLRAQGDEFESLLTQSSKDRETNVNEGNIGRQLDHVEDDGISYDPMEFLVTPTPTGRDTRNELNHEEGSTEPDQFEAALYSEGPAGQATSGNMEEYWNLNDYWNQVASILEGPVEQNLLATDSELGSQAHAATLDASCWESSLPNLLAKDKDPKANTSLKTLDDPLINRGSEVATASILRTSDISAEPSPGLNTWWGSLPDFTSNMEDAKVLDYVPVS
ncbi:hypothetical protein MMC17_006604 [Xylographa soralifera]|nr:hypothetical protein [Xylographa soralifera]